MPGCVKHSLHEPHAPENLDEELLGKHERAYAVDNDRFETLWLLQHAAMRSRFSLSLKASESCASAPSDRTSAFNQTRRFSATAPSGKHARFEKCYKKMLQRPDRIFPLRVQMPHPHPLEVVRGAGFEPATPTVSR